MFTEVASDRLFGLVLGAILLGALVLNATLY